ncbi:MAG: galactose-1-phosphate uridylyltransferase [Thaumarchaeota archaeon]|nr:galactose-1-phosphate uridylyltransferase [Nitrososphaerota archaeon]
MSHELRWNPLLGGWIIVAGKRKKRPWRSGECPFCPGKEETKGSWRVLALPNKFPALSPNAPEVIGDALFKKARALGECEVIIETPQHEGDFPDFPLDQVILYVKLLAERTRILESKPYIKQVIPFKNKGALIGVSLTHPHSQIYALPFIPPRIMREIKSAKEFRKKFGRNLFEEILRREMEEGTRIIYENGSFVLFMPFFAMWPYEMHVYPKKNVGSLVDLDSTEQADLADVIRISVKTYENLFGADCAYMMIFHQAPVDRSCRDFRLHLEFYSPNFSESRIKYAAGIEWGAWVFTYDGVPEERAAELKEAARKASLEIDHLGKVKN